MAATWDANYCLIQQCCAVLMLKWRDSDKPLSVLKVVTSNYDLSCLTELWGQMFLPAGLNKEHITQYPVVIHT